MTSRVPENKKVLLEIANNFGTPTYAYNSNRIHSQIETLRKHTAGISSRLLYAMKANSLRPILQQINKEGMGVDAVSPAELELALRIGFAPEHILFSSNNMTDDEMRRAASAGVTINIGELSRLRQYGKTYPGSEICVRLNPRIGAGHHAHVITAGEESKFGISVDQIDDIISVAHEFDLQIIGLHQHIGSGILETRIIWKAISVLLDAALNFPDLKFLNLGGGLGVPYRPDEKPLDMAEWESVIIKPLRKYRAKHPSRNLEFIFEPGRYIVAESGTLLVEVNTLKPSNDRIFAGVDSGMGHLLRPVIYGAHHTIYNLSNPDGVPRTYDVVGNICESADFFARDREVQEIREGDILAIMDVGAYGMSMASEYNLRPLPAEIMILENGDTEIISHRESAEEMIDRIYPELIRQKVQASTSPSRSNIQDRET